MVFLDQTVAVITALVVVRVQRGQTPRLFDPLLEATHFGVEDALANLCLARHLQHKIVGTEHLLALARSKAIVLALRPRVQLGWSRETRGSMCPNRLYFGPDVPIYREYLKAKVYTIWVHGPSNPKP